MTETSCPIWQTPATMVPVTGDGKRVDSPRAGGRYFISGTASSMIAEQDEPTKVQLTNWLVEQRRLGVTCPKISETILNETKMKRPLSVHDRAVCLLRYIDAKSDFLGTAVKFYSTATERENNTANELLAWTASRKISEVTTLAEYCAKEGWVEHQVTSRASGSGNFVHELMLMPPGYARLAELDGINSGSNQAFVAMWFDGSVQAAYYNGIEPAIRDAGYEPLRIDQREHINKIDDEIVAGIRRSRFLVADFTQGEAGARGGVYYEAGFAHGLNIPVIFTCHTGSIDKMHFDTRQYNHITWETPEELKEKLSRRISAVLGDGPLRRTG